MSLDFFRPLVHLIQGEIGSPMFKLTWISPCGPKEESFQIWSQLGKSRLSLAHVKLSLIRSSYQLTKLYINDY